jgi:hypothetical protein
VQKFCARLTGVVNNYWLLNLVSDSEGYLFDRLDKSSQPPGVFAAGILFKADNNADGTERTAGVSQSTMNILEGGVVYM